MQRPKFKIFDEDGYSLHVTDYHGQLFPPKLFLTGVLKDPKGNGIEISGLEVGINELQAILAFFQMPDDANLAKEAKQAARDGFTNAVKGTMLSARSGYKQ